MVLRYSEPEHFVHGPDAAFATGIGGGAFSGYMPSTGYFFPKSKSGTTLGIQAGVDNFGVSLIQLAGPWIIGFAMLGTTFLPARTTVDGGVMHLHNVAIFLSVDHSGWHLAWTMLKDVAGSGELQGTVRAFFK